MKKIAITGTGVCVPEHAVSNDELVHSYNSYVESFNSKNKEAIDAGDIEALPLSTVEFINKASGIKNRFFLDKEGILDITRMRPRLHKRTSGEPSYQAEASISAAEIALKQANLKSSDIDAVITACSTTQRDYPGLANEVQHFMNIKGFGFDMKMACSSATFGIQMAADTIAAGHAKRILVVTPELACGNINFRDRDSHFIFGDATTAVIVEDLELVTEPSQHSFEIISSKLFNDFSNNIRNEFGCLYGVVEGQGEMEGRFFSQNGRKVFKEVVPMAAEWMLKHILEENLTPMQVTRLWLHQANINMNQLIAKKILGDEASPKTAPIILDKYANTGACGSIIAFNHHHDDFNTGDLGLLCSFGAGYSIGSILLKKI